MNVNLKTQIHHITNEKTLLPFQSYRWRIEEDTSHLDTRKLTGRDQILCICSDTFKFDVFVLLFS